MGGEINFLTGLKTKVENILTATKIAVFGEPDEKGAMSVGTSNILTLKNLNNIDIQLTHKSDEFVMTNIWNWNYDEPDWKRYLNESNPVPIICKKNKLKYSIKDFAQIENLSPVLVLERYTKSKSRGSRSNSSSNGFKKIMNFPDYLPGEFPIEAETGYIDFKQENYFRAQVSNQDILINAKGKKPNTNFSVSYFQIKVKIELDGISYISNPLVQFAVTAIVQKNVFGEVPGVAYNEKYLSISYGRK